MEKPLTYIAPVAQLLGLELHLQIFGKQFLPGQVVKCILFSSENVIYLSIGENGWIFVYPNVPEVMKAVLPNLTFCVTFHNFSCLISACLLCCSRLISIFF